ncbi:hypothetical protein LTR85_007678 [Meristemomyces frigidus]|nr:hypothetical protein LTR85_007678 [Meristemomyces frigidus]
MAYFPLVPTLQTLACLVDTAPTHELEALHGIFDPYADLVHPEAWHEVLIYTYALLTPIEAGIMLLSPRLHQLGSALGKDPVFMQRIGHVVAAPRPAEVAEGRVLEGLNALTAYDGARLKDLVVLGVSSLKAKASQRSTCLWLVAAWAREAMELDVV